MRSSTVLLVEDDESLREALKTTLDLAGYQTFDAQNGKEALITLQRQNPDIVVSDIQMDQMDGNELLKAIRDHDRELPVLLMTAYGSVNGAVGAMQNGATDYLQKPFKPDALINLVNRYVRSPRIDMDQPVIEDPKSVALFDMAARVAKSDATVLLTGPSGAGKEVVARYIHQHSTRIDTPFIAINCAAIPENMLEASLFGYEKGAFTGAHQACPGKFERAQGGTLLLDEISEMDLSLQAKLLRVLQEKEVERLGSRKLIVLDVRVIATSNRDLRQEVSEGRFREDLYYRLNVFPLQCLALRERPLDIVAIAKALLSCYSEKLQRRRPKLSNEACNRLRRYGWPGNVRELQNVIQRALILQTGDFIQIGDIHLEAQDESILDAAQGVAEQTSARLVKHVQQTEFQIILDALQQHLGNRTAVSEMLGISPRTLRYKLARMREAGIEIP